MVQCVNGTYYTGSTKDVAARIKRHNAGHGAKYLRGKGPVRLVYTKAYRTHLEAARAEQRLKKRTRQHKASLARTLQSFKPHVDRRSRVLILGTMPGPMALEKQEYYGFPGNQFWPIMAKLFGAREPLSYPAKLRLLKAHRVALWDTIQCCRRVGASDGAIQDAVANDIPALIRRYPGIRRVFLNGKLAETLYRTYSAPTLSLPTTTLPSTSPAHATKSFQEKLTCWGAVKAAVR